VTYTLLALAGVASATVLDLVILRTRLLITLRFWFSWAIMVFFQLITNGWLTGREIVQYDESMILGLRIAYAPVEDLLFGFALILVTLMTWVRVTAHHKRVTP
jgi:lycopene cyclase domain-containing protein